jgi:hypothetical protein
MTITWFKEHLRAIFYLKETSNMLQRLLITLGLITVFGFGVSAQELDKTYYQPYNYPDSYELDRLSRNFTFSLSAPPIGSGYYSVMGYGDVAKINLTEFMNINFGLGFTGGLRRVRTHAYELDGNKGYDQERDFFAKAMAGGGLTFRLLNPLNFSVRTGLVAGYEEYTVSVVRPYYTSNESKLETLEYKQAHYFNFPISQFTNISVFYSFRSLTLSASHVNLYLPGGQLKLNYLGVVIPVAN